MNRDDFRLMQQGLQKDILNFNQEYLLKPIAQRGKDNGRALLMLHGFSSSPAVYRCLLPELKFYDAIAAPVLPGHADSIAAFSQAQASDWLAAAENAYQQLSKDNLQVDVLGLSLGGVLACYLSQHFPIHHLYLLSPALALRLPVKAYLRLARFCNLLGFRQVRNAAGNLLHDQNMEIAYRKLPIAAIIEILFFIDSFKWVAPTCPVDLFLGCHDKVIACQKVNNLFSKLPNATIHWLKNSAHVLPLDNDVDYIAACMNTEGSQPYVSDSDLFSKRDTYVKTPSAALPHLLKSS